MSIRYTAAQIDSLATEIGTRIKNATAAAAIKTKYESNADTNAFTDAEKTKLTGIEALADVTDATNVAAAGAVMESDASTAAMQFVVDEDMMTGNSDTKVPTQQSVKAYVDGAIAGLTALESEDIDTLAEINAIIGDATLVAAENTDTTSFAFVLDEDDMISDSATKVPTQQSVKAYVDATVSGIPGATNLAWDENFNQVTSSTGTNAIIPLASDGPSLDMLGFGVDGLMSGADKVKLVGIEAGATNDQDAVDITSAVAALDAALV